MPETALELRKFRRPVFAPPGGEWAIQVGEAHFSSRQSLSDLVSQVTRHLVANGQDIPEDLRNAIEDKICATMPPGVCTGPASGVPLHETIPGFFEVVKAMEDLFRGKPFECSGMQEAEDRMRICLICPKHSLRLCTNCDGLKATARKFVMGRKTKFDSNAGVCMVHRVPLCAIVHLKQVEARSGAPETCWVPNGNK